MPINSENHNKFIQPSIYFDEHLANFLKKFNDFYLLLKNITNSYNNKIIELKKILEKDDIGLNLTINDLSQIQEYILSLINQYPTKIINSSYNYHLYKSEVKIQHILKESSIKLENIFDLFKKDIVNKTRKFKNSINGFYIIASIYENIIINYFTKDIFDIIISHQKIEFNHSITSFYNYLIKTVNSIYQYILNNIPKNEIGFNNLLNKRENEIHYVFTQLIDKIIKSQNISLNIKEQQSILQIDENNFFNINSNLVKKILKN